MTARWQVAAQRDKKEKTMWHRLVYHGGALTVRGLFALVLGGVILWWADLTLISLMACFGVFLVLDGLVTMLAASVAKRHGLRWPMLWEGLVDIVVGGLTFCWPLLTSLSVLYLIAGWGIVTGLLESLAGVWHPREGYGEWFLGLNGLLSVLFGVLLLLLRGAGVLGLLELVSGYLCVSGLLCLGAAWRRRHLHQAHDRPMQNAA